MSEHCASRAPSKLNIPAGGSIRSEDAIKALVTKSANDVACSIGEAIGGDEETFARMMTKKAHALGMSRTIYRNASGLPDDEQVTTARDQATLGRAIQDRFPRHYRYFATRIIHLSRARNPQSQPSPWQRRGGRRHQDRLRDGIRLQSRDIGAAQRPPSRGCGAGWPQRGRAQFAHARPDQRIHQ